MLPASTVEGRNAHAAGFEGFVDGDLPGIVRLDNIEKPARHHCRGPALSIAPEHVIMLHYENNEHRNHSGVMPLFFIVVR